MYKLDDKK